jgi:hypothetical protein
MRIFGAYDAWPIHEKWPRPGRITIVVGRPIIFTTQDVEGGGKELYQRLSQQVMDAITTLRME